MVLLIYYVKRYRNCIIMKMFFLITGLRQVNKFNDNVYKGFLWVCILDYRHNDVSCGREVMLPRRQQRSMYKVDNDSAHSRRACVRAHARPSSRARPVADDRSLCTLAQPRKCRGAFALREKGK